MGIGALLFASFTSLFSVVNPITAMPVFMALTKEDTKVERKLTARKAAIYMFFVLITFFFAGTCILCLCLGRCLSFACRAPPFSPHAVSGRKSERRVCPVDS